MELLSALLLLGAPALGVGMGLYTRAVFVRRLIASWRNVTRKLGLVIESETKPRFGSPTCRARRGALVVDFKREAHNQRRGTLVTVSGLGLGAQDLAAKPESVGSWITKQLGLKDIELGAAADQKLVIEGDELLAQAVLDAATREALVQFLCFWPATNSSGKGGFDTSFRDGVLKVWLHDERPMDEAGLTRQLEAVLEPLLSLAERLTKPEDVVVRLSKRVQPGDSWEPEAGARLKCLRLLLREAPQHPSTLEAAQAGLSDEHDEIRFEAARVLGAEGLSTLLALAEGEAASDTVAARAISILAERLSAEQARVIFRRALAAGRSEHAVAALNSLTRSAFWQAENEALAGLASGLPPVALAACRALARAGTVVAVPELAQVGDRGPRELTQAARQAVAEIQARLRGAEPGQLSLSAAEAGALSLSQANEPGRLSLVGASRRHPPPLSAEQAEELLLLIQHPSTPSRKAAAAIETLGDRVPLEVAKVMLRRAITKRRRALARACARRLARASDPRLERLLLEALQVFRYGGAAQAAARALGRLGGPASVPLLRELEKAGSAQLADICCQALKRIRARLQGVEPGRLSLAGPEAGAVSFAVEPAAGQLSLAKAPGGKG